MLFSTTETAELMKVTKAINESMYSTNFRKEFFRRRRNHSAGSIVLSWEKYWQ